MIHRPGKVKSGEFTAAQERAAQEDPHGYPELDHFSLTVGITPSDTS